MPGLGTSENDHAATNVSTYCDPLPSASALGQQTARTRKVSPKAPFADLLWAREQRGHTTISQPQTGPKKHGDVDRKQHMRE